MLAACRDGLVKQGADLDAYTIAESAADVNDVRLALGYRQLDLYGLSYGTRLALAVMRDYPGTVRSAILDSVLPMQVNVVAELPAHIARALDLAFAACAGDAACQQANPALRASYFRLVAQLDAHPASLATRSGTVTFTGANLTRLLLAILIGGPRDLPDLITRLEQGDTGTLVPLIDDMRAPSTSTAWVMSFSVACSDGNYGGQATVAGAAAGIAQELRAPLVAGAGAIVSLCDAWPVTRVSPDQLQPVQSEVPTLVLEGAFDPITPPAYGQLAAQTLPHSFYLEFPDRGHHVLRDDCTYALAARFLANPAARPDTACLSGLPGPFADLQRGSKSSAAGPAGMTLDIQTLLKVCHPQQRALDAGAAAGQTVLAICQANNPGLTQAQLVSALMASFKMKLDAAVAAGTTTAADEAAALTSAQAQLTAWVMGPLN